MKLNFIHLEQATIINKSNNLQLTNENADDEQHTKRILMRCTNQDEEGREEEKNQPSLICAYLSYSFPF